MKRSVLGAVLAVMILTGAATSSVWAWTSTAGGGYEVGSSPAVTFVAAKKTRAALAGLSDNEGCAEATSEGVVVSRSMRGSKEIEGFEFNDKQYGKSYINVSLPEAMSRSKKAELHARILAVVKPGAKLRVKVQGCGAAARIEVVSEITPL